MWCDITMHSIWIVPLQKCLAYSIRNQHAVHVNGLIAVESVSFGSISKNLNHFISFICVLQSSNYNNSYSNNSMQAMLAHFNIICRVFRRTVRLVQSLCTVECRYQCPTLSPSLSLALCSLSSLKHLRHEELRKFPHLTYEYSIFSHFMKCNCMGMSLVNETSWKNLKRI